LGPYVKLVNYKLPTISCHTKIINKNYINSATYLHKDRHFFCNGEQWIVDHYL